MVQDLHATGLSDYHIAERLSFPTREICVNRIRGGRVASVSYERGRAIAELHERTFGKGGGNGDAD
jgi:hypothetical protein